VSQGELQNERQEGERQGADLQRGGGKEARKPGRRAMTLVRVPLHLGYAAVGLVGLSLAALAIVTPLDLRAQAAFGLFSVGLFFLINRIKDQRGRIGLIVLSMLVSTRYLWWRTTETLGFTDPFDAFFGYGLYAAELYGWIVLMIGYFQIIWPLDRKPKPLPADVKLWPVVDVYIPTYNESLDVVGPTVLAAMAMDYPADKFKVFILDDGRRPEFARFAREAGCGYIVRDNNNHAKAGNLNNALTVTNGELIAIFDCDHVPTRAFLQMTVGWFLHDPKLSMVQTPHHFYSPDPFERNLNTFSRVPNEGQLFYGLIQPGNDFWNAAFFCGSCAVISRKALLSVGGVQHQTVTEDAHTALRMQRKGWNTAFLALPLAAGLATERLSVHIGQRMRWARGMIQLFRTDNPLFGRGLKFGQRICYLNAMMYFLYPLPRFVFLTSPLAYLLLQQNIIMASALTVMAYAAPHLFHTIGTRSRIDGKFRYSFWGEIYDNVLLFHIIGPTLRALINPKAGKFNVTDKGGIIENEEYDSKAMKPLMVLVGLLVAAGCYGLYRLNLTDLYQGEREVILMNVFWCLYSMFTLLAALAVGRERRQVRAAPRIDMKVPVTVYYDGRHSLVGKTVNVSLLGAMLRFDELPANLQPNERILLNFDALDGNASVPARVVGFNKRDLRLEFAYESLTDKRTVVRAVFGRADAWIGWTSRPTDNVGGSLGELGASIRTLADYVYRTVTFRRRPKPKAETAAAPAPASIVAPGHVLPGGPMLAPMHAVPAE
jgi:cellulose synthase (UDP-forming)